MDQDIEIINTSTRIEKIKNFFIQNKKILISIFSIILILLFSYFFYNEIKKKDKLKLADKYNQSLIEFNKKNNLEVVKNSLKEIIKKKDSTYSPLALYFLIDNQLVDSNDEINKYFDLIIEETNLDKEIKNLIIYKKGLFNSEFISEDKLLNTLKPLINSESVWKSHALYLMGEYFYSKGENKKSLEFFNKIVTSDTSNKKIKLEAEKRIRRDLSE